MKNLSKALALFVVVAMMLTSVMSVAAFTDVDNGSTYERAINVDAALGLLNGYPDGTFQPEGSITRAEFAAVVVRMLGQETQAAGSANVTPYADVAADHWAAGYINIATQLGIINGYGDGNFGPEDPVLYEQAVKMVVIALGYGPVCDPAAYPVSYLTKAGQVGITTGLKGENGANANRGLVAQIIYNSLDKPLMKETGYGLLTSYEVCDGVDRTKATVLDEYLDTVKVLAKVEDTTATSSATNKAEKVKLDILKAYKSKYSLTGEDFAENKSPKIGVGDTNASDYVGKNAIVYINYIEGYLDDAEIVYIEEDDSEKLEITSVQFENATANGNYTLVEYRENSSDRYTQTIKVTRNPAPSIYVNGVKQNNVALETVLGTAAGKNFYGKVEFTLLDSTNQYDYDTVSVTDYDTIVVDSVDTRSSRVNAKNDTAVLKYDSANNDVKATLYDTNGDVMDWADLKEFDVVSYTKTNTTTKNIIGYLVDNVISGRVDGVDDDEYTIGGEEYSLGEGLAAGDIVLGDEGDFYLDIMGNIAYFEESDDVVGGRNYAYVSSVKKTEDNELKLRLFTTDGKVDWYTLNSTVSYDDLDDAVVKATDKITENAVQNNTAGLVTKYQALKGQVIAYKLNTSNLIKSVELPDKGVYSQKRSEFTALYNYTTTADGVNDAVYQSSIEAFTVGGSKLFTTDSTVIFNLGADSTAAFTGYDDLVEIADYEIISVSELEEDATLKNARFFNVDSDEKTVGIIVASAYIEGSLDITSIAVAAGSGKTTDEDGVEIDTIKAFSDLEAITYLAEDDSNIVVPSLGSVFIPTIKSGTTLKTIKPLVNVNENTKTVASTFGATSTVTTGTTTVKYYFDTLDSILKNRNIELVNGTTLKIPSAANIYVVDETVPAKNRVSVDDLSYINYVDANGTIPAHFENDKEETVNVVFFGREFNGKIVDVVLYVGYTE